MGNVDALVKRVLLVLEWDESSSYSEEAVLLLLLMLSIHNI